MKFTSKYIEEPRACFIAFNSKTVFLYCGEEVIDADVQMRLAIYMTKIISAKMGPQVKIVKNLRKQGESSYSFNYLLLRTTPQFEIK